MKMARRVIDLPWCGIQDILALKHIPDILDLGIGSPHFETPSNVIDAASQAMRFGTHKYSADEGIIELREAILEKTKHLNDFEFDVHHNIVVTCGTSPAIFNTMLAIINSGDEVVITTPTYFAYAQMVRMVGGRPIFVHSSEENAFVPTQEELSNAINTRTRLLVINTPCNPTGASWTKQELSAVADLATDHDFLVLSDELYERFVYDDIKHWSIASIDNMIERTITITGLSKSHSMAGYRIGWVIGPKEFIKLYLNVHQQVSICAPVMSQYAAVEALKNSNGGVRTRIMAYQKNRDIMYERINGEIPFITAIKPKGNIFLFPNITELLENHFDDMVEYLDSQEGRKILKLLSPHALNMVADKSSPSFIATLFLAGRGKVVVTPGDMFGPGGKSHLRFSLAQPQETINAALDRLAKVLQKWA